MNDEQGIEHSRDVAEQARERSWAGESFLRELFLGSLRPDLLAPAPASSAAQTMPEHAFADFRERVARFLRREVDPVEIDASGEYPPAVIEGLARLGVFGMKIAAGYGGLGLSHAQYVQIMQLMGSHDANLTALVSAHQAIGVPHPVQMFGSDALKEKYLPRCARGAISAFALTEPAVGSDPARLQTRAVPTGDGREFILDGLKLWCTNGTLAEVIVVLARNPETDRISCFVVEMDWEGVTVERRCHFMGLRALGNALISFRGVRVPRENLVGKEGDGLRVALATLNTGRLTLPAGTAGAAKVALEICRKWAGAREQWGQVIGKHEAIAHELSAMACTAYAMESLATTVGHLADRDDRDLRLEAAAAKEWNTTAGWDLLDGALQVRGGRGYETERSLAARGEPPLGIERMLRDSRINRIFEGSSEIMHLFIAREALDKHLRVAGDLVDARASLATRLRALPRVLAFYALWYPKQWLLGALNVFRFRSHGRLGGQLRYAERVSRRLARSLFHGMVRHGPALERKQAFLFRGVDVALEVFALVATTLRAQRHGDSDPGGAALALHQGRRARRRIEDLLRDMWRNDDAVAYDVGRAVLEDRHLWLERDTVGVPYGRDDMVPMTVQEYLERPQSDRGAERKSA
ncbi:MAG: acyl-CoA dehydrogenase family protein [Myxococcales bacterium]